MLWDQSCGPCWIKETEAALARLDQWRSDILNTEPPDMNASLAQELSQNQAVFNGFGKHLAIDFLHEQCLWPGMPPYALCASDALFRAFREGIPAYMRRWMSQEYWHDCLGCYNLDRPFAHNRTSDQRYLNKYVQVFRKAFATDMPAELYNTYVERGLLDPEHVVGARSSTIFRNPGFDSRMRMRRAAIHATGVRVRASESQTDGACVRVRGPGLVCGKPVQVLHHHPCSASRFLGDGVERQCSRTCFASLPWRQ